VLECISGILPIRGNSPEGSFSTNSRTAAARIQNFGESAVIFIAFGSLIIDLVVLGIYDSNKTK
jgi:hypothetical protein